MSAPTPTGTALTGNGSTTAAGFRVGAKVTFTCTGSSDNLPNTLTISGQSAVSNSSNATSISATYTITSPSTSFTISATCTGKAGGSVTVSSVAKPIYRVFQLQYEQNGASSIGSTSSKKWILAANSSTGNGGSAYTLPSITAVSVGRGGTVDGWDVDNSTHARFKTGASVSVCTTGTSGCSGTGSGTTQASSGVIQLGADYDARKVFAITHSTLNNPTKSTSGVSSSGTTFTTTTGNIYIWNTSNKSSISFTLTNRCKSRTDGKTTFAYHADGGANNGGTICTSSQSSCSKPVTDAIYKSNYSFGCMKNSDASTFVSF